MALKKFRFSLDSVLKLRQHETELARLALSRAVQRRQRQEDVVEAAQQQRNALLTLPAQQQALNPRHLQQRLQSHEQATRALEEAKVVLRRLQVREQEAHAALAKHHQVEASLQMLHDEEQLRYRQAQDEEEAKFLDEQAVAQYARRQQSV